MKRALQELKKPLPGFETISRRFDRQMDVVMARILPGEYYVTMHEECIVTVLGSCISVCVRDPYTKIGGMNHFMLPESEEGQWAGTAASASTRYGNYAMEYLINQLLSHGAARNSLEIKVFGGGNVLKGGANVGTRNTAFVENYMRSEGYRINAMDVGGDNPRKVLYYPLTGKVLLKHLHTSDDLIQQERNYKSSIEAEDDGGEVDLF
ncbi:MAG: chemoreceptor glutamine deamidase CheD [bacterium]